MKPIRVAVIGGGASGMMAAIEAARGGAEVTLIERNDRVGKKILVTGNGKCNLSNRCMGIACYRGKHLEMAEKMLARFGVDETISFYQNLGMLIKEKNGYLYPASEQASTVLDVLRLELQHLHVTVLTETKVSKIEKKQENDTFVISTNQKSYIADKVILSCGGKAAPKTGSDGSGYYLAAMLGHRIVPVVPSLVQLRCEETYMKAVAGVRLDALVRLVIDGQTVQEERGELQLTDYGISGIPVFQLSRMAAYALSEKKKVEVYIDSLPDFTEKTYRLFQTSRMLLQTERTAEEFFLGIMNKKITALFIKLAGLKATENIEKANPKFIDRVFALYRNWKLTVIDSNSYEQAQVCAGGVDMSQVTECLESKLVKNLFLTGELLDIDGRCGGYNLQWAWTSGYIAGHEVVKHVTD